MVIVLGMTLWVLVGVGVVLYGIKQKKRYGFSSQINLVNLIIVLVGVLIWPAVLASTLSFKKKQEEVIGKVIAENPKLTREDILKGCSSKFRHERYFECLFTHPED